MPFVPLMFAQVRNLFFRKIRYIRRKRGEVEQVRVRQMRGRIGQRRNIT